MKIAIVGTGNVGSVLGRRLGVLGHKVIFVSRQPESEKSLKLRALPGVTSVVSQLADAVSESEIVIYAGPYPDAESILSAVADFADRVLVDCTNPLNSTFDGLLLGHTESAAERIAQWATNARVVKSFNTSSVATMADPIYGDMQATQFYCGDDPEAKELVRGLIRELQMEPVDAGPLRNARYLEATAMLYIHLAVRGGWGGNCALKMLRR